MKSKTINPKTINNEGDHNQLPQAELWRSFYALSQHWQSDLKFFEDELNFFRTLVDKNLSLLIEPMNIEQTRTMVAHIIALEKERAGLQEQILQHVKHIIQLIENPFVLDAQRCKDDHEKLESTFAIFLKQFQSVKTEVFKLNERVAHSEKAKRLLDLAKSS